MVVWKLVWKLSRITAQYLRYVDRIVSCRGNETKEQRNDWKKKKYIYSKNSSRFISGRNDPSSIRYNVSRRTEESNGEEGQTTLSLSRPDEQENRLIVSPNNGSSVKAASVASWFQRLHRALVA